MEKIESEGTSLAIRPRTNKEMQLRHREQYLYFLWISDKYTLEEIKNETGLSVPTIWRTLRKVREEMKSDPNMADQIRLDTYLSMRLDHAEIVKRALETENAQQAAKLWEVAATINKTILERYTQMGPESSRASEMGMAVVDYITEKFGPEELPQFLTWYEKRKESARMLRQGSK